MVRANQPFEYFRFLYLKSLHMAYSQIDPMDIIADPGSVRRCIVVAENRELGQLTNRHLRYIRYQIIENTIGIFAYPTAFMGADRIEITEQTDIPSPKKSKNRKSAKVLPR